MIILRLPAWSDSHPDYGEAAAAASPETMKTKPIRSSPI
jgi:hypothetical protein